MLRNQSERRRWRPWSLLLNEVLSLNAQELQTAYKDRHVVFLLNEVLSLNAQEYMVALSTAIISSPQ